ncbi:MAG: extracellular solute-binding protein [Pseudomonadota bacterium]
MSLFNISPLALRAIQVSFLGVLLAFLSTSPLAQNITKSHAIAMHGSPKYGPDFKRFDYTSAEAKKGGLLRLSGFGTFDSLNAYIAKGNAAERLALIYDTLTVAAADEPFTQYGLLAKSIEYPQDRSWVIFTMRPEARFHDGQAVTAADVVFTFNLLMEKGNPAYKFYYADVAKVEALDKHRVKYSFKTNTNRELLLTVGTLPVLPQHFWQDKAFDKSSLDIPLGSGPYKIGKVDPGQSLSFTRVKDYWARDLAVNQGMYNFDDIRIDYYRDENVAIEGLKAGEYDYRWENSSKFWATAYSMASVQQKRLLKKEVGHKANSGMQGFIFNLRKPVFADKKLRKAIAYAFDFEWSNQTLFYNAYTRSDSFFSNSELAATGLPEGKELELLTPYKDKLPASVFTEPFTLPVSDGSGRNRQNLRKAKQFLDDSGYKVVDGQLNNPQGQAVSFEILLASPAFERIVNPFIKNLSRLGIDASIRLVDTSQYINRRRSFDYDMIVHVFAQGESPGNEQLNFWGSEAADTEGSFNLMGLKDPVVDAMIDKVINADSRENLVYATRALDRVLLHTHSVIPQWYKASSRIVYWDKFGIPAISPAYDRYYMTAVLTWWYDEKRAAKIANNTQ